MTDPHTTADTAAIVPPMTTTEAPATTPQVATPAPSGGWEPLPADEGGRVGRLTLTLYAPSSGEHSKGYQYGYLSAAAAAHVRAHQCEFVELMVKRAEPPNGPVTAVMLIPRSGKTENSVRLLPKGTFHSRRISKLGLPSKVKFELHPTASPEYPGALVGTVPAS